MDGDSRSMPWFHLKSRLALSLNFLKPWPTLLKALSTYNPDTHLSNMCMCFLCKRLFMVSTLYSLWEEWSQRPTLSPHTDNLLLVLVRYSMGQMDSMSVGPDRCFFGAHEISAVMWVSSTLILFYFIFSNAWSWWYSYCSSYRAQFYFIFPKWLVRHI